ncbi:hypothetical protein B0H17DRAFT_1086272 [Mycena rosella]|uniref:Uncharacterized protein n=1 Tax=Mycena rosella TaxID=1033263 RepID=A0AAD7G8I1_MYCRO|nr:hypothetical protein B0H17DRAFT_1086272 [Mycena rosella]
MSPTPTPNTAPKPQIWRARNERQDPGADAFCRWLTFGAQLIFWFVGLNTGAKSTSFGRCHHITAAMTENYDHDDPDRDKSSRQQRKV